MYERYRLLVIGLFLIYLSINGKLIPSNQVITNYATGLSIQYHFTWNSRKRCT